jgi:hypothetical protein
MCLIVRPPRVRGKQAESDRPNFSIRHADKFPFCGALSFVHLADVNYRRKTWVRRDERGVQKQVK